MSGGECLQAERVLVLPLVEASIGHGLTQIRDVLILGELALSHSHGSPLSASSLAALSNFGRPTFEGAHGSATPLRVIFIDG